MVYPQHDRVSQDYPHLPARDRLAGSISVAFAVCIHTENQNQVGFYPFVLREISVLTEPALGHLRYRLTDVPPQPNSPPDTVFDSDRSRGDPGGTICVQRLDDSLNSAIHTAMNAWLPQASYPCGNFSDTSSLKLLRTKGSIGQRERAWQNQRGKKTLLSLTLV